MNGDKTTTDGAHIPGLMNGFNRTQPRRIMTLRQPDARKLLHSA